MTSNSILHPVTARGWRAGFNNLFRKENRDWWGTRSWLVQAIIWTVILIGILTAVLSAKPNGGSLEPQGGQWLEGLVVFFAVAGMALPIGAVWMSPTPPSWSSKAQTALAWRSSTSCAAGSGAARTSPTAC